MIVQLHGLAVSIPSKAPSSHFDEKSSKGLQIRSSQFENIICRSPVSNLDCRVVQHVVYPVTIIILLSKLLFIVRYPMEVPVGWWDWIIGYTSITNCVAKKQVWRVKCGCEMNCICSLIMCNFHPT